MKTESFESIKKNKSMSKNSNCPFPPGALVYAYLRHSPGDSQTITSQDAAVRAWCIENGLQLGRVFKDEAKSGTSTAGRDDFLLMMDTLRDSNLKPRPIGIVLWSFSRFARDVNDAEYYKADLRRRRYIVFSLTDKVPDGDIAPVFESLIHWKDAERSREISRDAKRGLRWLAEQGYSVGGFPPRGYCKSAPVEVGRKKNGESRLACKWEFDSEWQARVQRAWQMKLAGALNWDIHRATRVFDSINSYTTFFTNITYAGFRKCSDLVIPNAHPAYVTEEEFNRVQAMRQPAPANRPHGSDPNHPHRRSSLNPLLLSGILYCGYCGAAMVGNKNGRDHFYTCNKKQRQGHEVCQQPSIVAHALHSAVVDWMLANVITVERLIDARDIINKQLSGTRDELKQRRHILLTDHTKSENRIQNLLDAIEENGASPEIEARLSQRRMEKRDLEHELAKIEATLQINQIEISNEALIYLAQYLKGALLDENPDSARGVIRSVFHKVEMFKEKIIAQYSVPLSEISNQLKVGYSVCPHGNSNPSLGLERATS